MDTTTLPSIEGYLRKYYGRSFRKEAGGRLRTNSPFCNDTNPSLVVYPDNTWYDYASGQGGNIITLARKLDGNLDRLKDLEGFKVPEVKPLPKKWNPSAYLGVTDEEKQAIMEYALAREIVSGYKPGVYFRETGERVPSLLFEHQNHYGKVVGAKFRNINPTDKTDRFRVRGELGFYILSNIIPGHYSPPRFYLIESETSANSFHRYCCDTYRNVVVASAGAVSTPPESIPARFKGMEGYVIIDHDGKEDLYQERIKRYSHLNLTPVKLVLGSGDINSLYCNKQLWMIENLL